MVSKLLRLLRKEISGVHEAAYLLGIFSVLSLVLGLVRDRLLASTFGAGWILDSYYAAFKIPDTIFISVASLVSASVLVPFVIQRQADKLNLKKFVNSIFSVFGLLVIFVCGLIFIFAGDIVKLIFSGFNSQALSLTTTLTRIMLLQPIFLGFSGFLSSIIQAKQRFFSYALAPVLYNGGIIIGVIVFYPLFGLTGLAFGVVLGALLHFLIQIPSFYGLSFIPKWTFNLNWKEVFSVFKISLPRTLTLSASSLAILGLLALGSKSGSGSITVFNFGWNIQSAPLSVIAASYAMAVFPSLSKFFQLKDIKNYLLTISNTFKHIVFWVVPATILLIVLRAQIVRSILGFGEFSWRDTKLTAAILAIFSVSVLAQGLIVLLVRAFYAVGNTKIPLFVNVIFSGLSVYFAFVFKTLIIEIPLVSLFFIDLLRLNGVNNINVLALPMGFSLAVILNFSVLLLSFKLKFKNFHIETSRLIREHLGASLAGGLSAYGALYLFSDVFPNDKVWGVFTTGLLSGIIGIIIIGFILFLMKNRELMEFLTHFNKRIFKANPQGSDYIEN